MSTTYLQGAYESPTGDTYAQAVAKGVFLAIDWRSRRARMELAIWKDALAHQVARQPLGTRAVTFSDEEGDLPFALFQSDVMGFLGMVGTAGSGQLVQGAIGALLALPEWQGWEVVVVAE